MDTDGSKNMEIDNTDRYFKGQQKTEEVICFFRRHWIVLIRPIFVFLFINAVFIVCAMFLFRYPALLMSSLSRALAVSFLAVCTILIHRFFVELLDYYVSMVIITNFRVIDLKKTIILHDDKDVIDLFQIQDIQKIQDGFAANILNYGLIRAILSGAHESKIFHCVPNPDWYFRRINEMKRNYSITHQMQREASGIAGQEKILDSTLETFINSK